MTLSLMIRLAMLWLAELPAAKLIAQVIHDARHDRK